MKNFTYFRPRTPEQAVGLLDARWGTSALLGGGTDLLDLQKEYIVEPDKVISLSGLGEGFRSIQVLEKKPPAFTLGAGVHLATIAGHAKLRRYCQALTQAAGEAATPQIRNMATLGGNLCQRNR